MIPVPYHVADLVVMKMILMMMTTTMINDSCPLPRCRPGGHDIIITMMMMMMMMMMIIADLVVVMMMTMMIMTTTTTTTTIIDSLRRAPLSPAHHVADDAADVVERHHVHAHVGRPQRPRRRHARRPPDERLQRVGHLQPASRASVRC